MQRTFYFGEQLFTVVCSTKNTHYFLGMVDKVGESSRKLKHGFYRSWGYGKQETWTSNLLNIEDQWVSFVVVMILLHS